MKTRGYIYLSLMAWILFLMYPTFINADWKWENCKRSSEGEALLYCHTAPSEYTKPYCYYSWSNESIDYISKCQFSVLANMTMWSSKEEVIKQYCHALLSQKQNDWRIYYAVPEANWSEWDWAQTFDSHQSLFMYIFCESFKDDNGSSVFLNQSYDYKHLLKWDTVKILKLQQKSKGKDLCSIKSKESSDLSDCDMSIYATDIFSAIMSDVFKIKYAQVFQLDSVKNYDKRQARIEAFISWYFNMTEWYKTLQSEFPQTIDVINANQKYYKQILDGLVLLNNDKLADIANDAECNSNKNQIWENFIACALHGSNWNGMTLEPSFITWFSNELLNYRMFMQYYQSWLTKSLEEVKSKWDSWQVDQMKLTVEITDLKEYVDMQLDVAWQTFHELEDVSMTYPLHIWLLLYQEKIKRFRDKNLSPIVTHFYSLSEKLQNVQIRDS